MTETMICPICGAEFTPRCGQKYCRVECRTIAKRRQERSYKREDYKKNATKDEPVARTVQTKCRPLSSLSGEELLHYGAIQQSMNRDSLRVHIPTSI